MKKIKKTDNLKYKNKLFSIKKLKKQIPYFFFNIFNIYLLKD